MTQKLSKMIFILTLAIGFLPAIAFSQSNLRLSDASFDQIVEELKYRFRVSSNADLIREMQARLENGGGTSRYSLPHFSCSGKYLILSLTDEFGQRKTYSHNIVVPKLCQDQAAILTANVPREIQRLTVAAYCSTRHLIQLPLLPNGGFGQYTENHYSSNEDCLVAQKEYYDRH